MLHGEDEWLEALVARSEVAAAQQVSSGSRPLSFNDPHIAEFLRQEDEWLRDLVDRSDIVYAPTCQQATSSLRQKLDRHYKWGQCNKCVGRSLQPHVMGAGSKEPGKLVLYCRNWWRPGPLNGRLCWQQFEFPMERFCDLNRAAKTKCNDLRLSLARNARPDGRASERL